MRWTAKIELASITSEDIAEGEGEGMFADPQNPTDAEIRAYFAQRQENYAGSNDGSELIANARLEIVKS